MDDREYFTVQETSLTIPRSGALAIFAGDKPRKNADGLTSYSLRGPMLLMPQEMWEDAEDTMQGVAKVLNENAHLFFDSAPKPAALEPDAGVVAELVEALRLADAALSGANMNMAVVEKKVKAALARVGVPT